MKKLVDIFKGKKEQEMYLFVEKEEGIERVPKMLLDRLGELQLVTTLPITEERKLARTDGKAVLDAILEQGFYLQLPPSKEAYLQEINRKNSMMGQ